MAGSVFEQYADENAVEQEKERRAHAPLTLLGFAVAVFLGNLFTAIVGAIIWMIVRALS